MHGLRSFALAAVFDQISCSEYPPSVVLLNSQKSATSPSSHVHGLVASVSTHAGLVIGNGSVAASRISCDADDWMSASASFLHVGTTEYGNGVAPFLPSQ